MYVYELFFQNSSTTNTPTLNEGDRGGVRILLFSEITLFKNNVSTILSPIVATKSLSPLLLIYLFHSDLAGRFNLPFTSDPILFSRDVIVMVSIIDQEFWLGPG